MKRWMVEGRGGGGGGRGRGRRKDGVRGRRGGGGEAPAPLSLGATLPFWAALGPLSLFTVVQEGLVCRVSTE